LRQKRLGSKYSITFANLRRSPIHDAQLVTTADGLTGPPLSSGVSRQGQYPDVVVASVCDRSNPVPSAVRRGLGRVPCVPQRPHGCALSRLEPYDGASCSCLLVEGVEVY
jgi:hypothetical protein